MRAWPTSRYLSEQLGVSKKTVDRGLAQLKLLGIIRISYVRGRRVIYLINLPTSEEGKIDTTWVTRWMGHIHSGGRTPLDQWQGHCSPTEQTTEQTNQQQPHIQRQNNPVLEPIRQDVDVKLAFILEMGITGAVNAIYRNHSLMEIAAARYLVSDIAQKEYRPGKAVQLLRDGVVSAYLGDENKVAKLLHKLRTREIYTLKNVITVAGQGIIGGIDFAQIDNDPQLQALIAHHRVFEDSLLILKEPPVAIVLQRLDSFVKLLDAGQRQESASDPLVEEEQIQRDLLGCESLLPREDSELDSER